MSTQYPHGSTGHGTNGDAASQQQSWPNIFGLTQPSQQMQSINNATPQHQYASGQDSTNGSTVWNDVSGQTYINANPGKPAYNGLRTDSHNMAGASSDPVLHFFNSMPTLQDDPSRHSLWTELVRLKTRALELQIAEAKAKEKEAEAELLRLKDLYRTRGGRSSFSQPIDNGQQPIPLNQPFAQSTSVTPNGPYGQAGLQPNQTYNPNANTVSGMSTGAFPTPTQNSMLQLNMSDPLQSQQQQPQIPTSMTTFDLEAMMQTNNLDNMFSWLPDFGDSTHSQNTIQGQTTSGGGGGGIDPNDLLVTSDPFNTFFNTQNLATPMSVKPNLLSPPPARRSRSPEDDEPPSAKRAKRPEKKLAVEHIANCRVCSKPLARTIIRAPKHQIPETVSLEFTCTACRAVPQPPALNDVPAPASGSGIGTVDTRKRLRIAMEAEDEERKEVEGRRAFCDVCQRVFGSGMVSGGGSGLGLERENLAHMTEIICSSCDAKYAR